MRAAKLVVLGLVLGAALGASQVDSGAASSAGRWLALPGSARIASLAELGATASGVDALSYNPSGLAKVAGTQLSLSRNNWLGDASSQNLAGALRLGPGGLGLALQGVDFGQVDTYTVNASGSVDQGASLRPGAWAVKAGYGLELGAFRVGLALSGLQEDLSVQKSQGYGLDLGAGMDWGAFRVGLGLQGALGALGGESLPRTLLLDGGWKAWDAGALRVDLLAGLRDGLSDRMLSGALGAEARLYGKLALRGGWRAAGAEDAGGWAAGVGVWPLPWLGLDYAYNNMGALQATNQWSLELAWGGSAAPRPEPAPVPTPEPVVEATPAPTPEPGIALADSFREQIRARNFEAASQTAQTMGQPAPQVAEALYQQIKWQDVKDAVFDGRFEDAERMLDLIRNLNPGDAAYVEEALGMMAWHQGRKAEAAEHFRAAAALDPNLGFLLRFVPGR